MKMQHSSFLLLQFGMILLLVSSETQAQPEVYHVKPTISTNTSSCQNHSQYQCESLDFYFSKLPYAPHRNITLVFTNGRYISNLTYQPGFIRADALQVIGIVSTEEVKIESVNMYLQDIGSVRAENVTLHGSVLEVKRPIALYSSTNFTLISCIFNGTQIRMENVNLKISSTYFFSSPSTAVSMYSSTIILSGEVKFINNTGAKGGALALMGTTLMIDRSASILFEDNTANEIGGAIYTNAPKPTDPRNFPDCFYQLINFNQTDSDLVYNMSFSGNFAVQSGDHIYGAGMKVMCAAAYEPFSNEFNWIPVYNYDRSVKYHFNVSMNPSSLSEVSGDPSRVCICDNSSQPQCTNISKIFLSGIKVYLGEPLTLSAVVVGGDFGITTGNIFANILYSNNNMNSTIRELSQVVNAHKECTNLTYSILSSDTAEVIVYLTATEKELSTARNSYKNYDDISEKCDNYKQTGYINPLILDVPVFINITVLPCPPGFTLLGDPPGCDCYPVLALNGAKCKLHNGVGSITWDTHMWLSISVTVVEKENITKLDVSENCQHNYCKINKTVNLYDQDKQCQQHRTGRLCGRCKEKYSLSIGSFNCLNCTNNNNLALLFFFTAAGPLLVMIISVLNLTVTQGTINGLIFYANIIWTYKSFFFPQKISGPGVLIFLQVFVAWLNLDFGIETCFFKGLNAFWKTWLQYVFPFYTAGLFFTGLRYSSKLSKLCGDRSVPTLATLLFLSYTKLLRTIIASLQLAHVTNYLEINNVIEKESITKVWALDGNLTYGWFPHIFLLLAALACLLVLWIPYTLLLLSMQWLRKIDHYQPLRLISKYKPVYDAYFGPLRDKHHYWFGVLLLAQGVVLITSSLTIAIIPAFSVLFLLTVVLILLSYVNFAHVYKRKSVTILESLFLINLALAIGGTMYYKENDAVCSIITHGSITFAFLKFLVIIMMNVAIMLCQYCLRVKRNGYNNLQKDEEYVLPEHIQLPAAVPENAHFRDSIFDGKESQIRVDEATY